MDEMRTMPLSFVITAAFEQSRDNWIVGIADGTRFRSPFPIRLLSNSP